jgi:hypothetical protein
VTRHRLVYRHRADDIDGIDARAVIARTVHGSHDHGMLRLIEEHSTPTACYWDVEADDEVWSGLRDVAQQIGSG